jgi:hypothetical protein
MKVVSCPRNMIKNKVKRNKKNSTKNVVCFAVIVRLVSGSPQLKNLAGTRHSALGRFSLDLCPVESLGTIPLDTDPVDLYANRV